MPRRVAVATGVRGTALPLLHEYPGPGAAPPPLHAPPPPAPHLHFARAPGPARLFSTFEIRELSSLVFVRRQLTLLYGSLFIGLLYVFTVTDR